MKQNRSESDFYPALTGIRGVAAVWVLLFHAPGLMGILFPEIDYKDFVLVRSAYLGLDLFFVLSGFILSLVYINAFSSKGFVASAS